MKMEQWRLSSLKLTSSFLTLLQRHPDIHWTLLKICLKSQGRILTIPTAFMYFFPFFNPRFDLHLNFYPLLHLVFKTWNHRDRAFYRLIFLGFPTMSIFVYFCCLFSTRSNSSVICARTWKKIIHINKKNDSSLHFYKTSHPFLLYSLICSISLARYEKKGIPCNYEKLLGDLYLHPGKSF